MSNTPTTIEAAAAARQAVYDTETAHLERVGAMLLSNAEAKARAILGPRFRSMDITLGTAKSTGIAIWIFTRETEEHPSKAYGGESSFTEVFDILQRELAEEARNG